MGFMEGFANSFGRQMEIGQQQRAQAKRDAFQIAYDKYIKDRAEYDKALSEDTKLINSAKAITSSMPNIPEGAWEHAYSWLKSGYTPLQVEEKLKSSVFASQEQPAMPDNPQTVQAADKVKDQTVASGLVPGQEETTGQQDPDLMGSIFGANGLLNPDAVKQRQMQGAQSEVMKQTGISQQEFDRVSQGYKPTQLSGNAPAITGVVDPSEIGPPGLKAFNDEYQVLFVKDPVSGQIVYEQGIKNAKGEWVDSEGNPIQGDVIKDMPQSSFDDYNKAVGLIGPMFDDLNTKKLNTLSVVEDAVSLAQIVDRNPEVLTIGGQAQSLLTTGITQLASIFEATQSMTSPEFRQAEENLLREVQGSLGNMGDTTSAYTAFLSQQIKFAFALARANAGTGNMSNQEVQNAFQMINAVRYEDFIGQLDNIVKGRVNAFDREARVAMNDYRVREAQRHGINVDEMIGPLNDMYSEDANTFMSGERTPRNTNEETPSSTSSAGQGEVLSSGTITADMISQYPEGYLTEDDIGRPYREFANGIEFLD